jgi:hypothetical protein
VTKPKTSVKTSVVPVPQPHGGALLPGGTGAGGRPVERWRRACREALEEAGGLSFVVGVIKGTEVDQMIVGDGEDARVLEAKPKVRDRLYAVQLLAEHGHGKPPQELQIDEPKQRPTGDALVARVLELLPRVIAVLPVDRQEIARLFKQRQEVELIVQGKQVTKTRGAARR